MFEHLTQKPLTEQDQQFITLYIKFLNGTAWLNAAPRTYRDKKDFMIGVQQPMDGIWAAMDQEARMRCARKLIEQGYLQKDFLAAIEVFNATVVSIS
jgi:hypothetical protein